MVRRPRVRRAAVLTCAVVLVVLGGVGWAATRPGPVRFDTEGTEGSAWAYALAGAGQRPVFGLLGVTNHGDRPAVLRDARLTGPSDEVVDGGARVVQVLVRDAPAGEDYLGAAPDWPAEHFADDAVPLEGHVLAPGATVEVLYVVAVDVDGHWFWPRSELTYTSGGRRHRTSTSTGFLICPPEVRACERPG